MIFVSIFYKWLKLGVLEIFLEYIEIYCCTFLINVYKKIGKRNLAIEKGDQIMKKKLTLILLATCLSLTALTGCKNDKAPVPAAKTEETTKEKDAFDPKEYENNVPFDKSAVEGINVIAPPLDADGNLPEGLDKDTYYDGFVEQAKEEKKQEEAAKKSKSDTSKDTKATKTSEKK